MIIIIIILIIYIALFSYSFIALYNDYVIVRFRNTMRIQCMSYSYNHLIFNKCEWNNCFVKNTHKI